MFMETLLGEREMGASGQDWLTGSWGKSGEGCFGVQSSDVFRGCGDTKGPVCPSLVHALHSHALSSLGVEGGLEGKGPSSWLRAWVAPLPASS